MAKSEKVMIGKAIKRFRRQSGMTQEQMGQLFEPKLARGMISSWENRKALPSAHNLSQLSRVIGLPVHALISQDGMINLYLTKELADSVLNLIYIGVTNPSFAARNPGEVANLHQVANQIKGAE